MGCIVTPSRLVLSLGDFLCVGLIPQRRFLLKAAVIYILPDRIEDNLLKKSSFLYGAAIR